MTYRHEVSKDIFNVGNGYPVQIINLQNITTTKNMTPTCV